MKQFVSFVIKESKHILRDRRTMLILFGMPVVMMMLFGFAISTDVRNVRTVIVTSSMDHLTQQMAHRLDASEYFAIVALAHTPAEAEQMMRNQKADMAIVFAQDFANHRYDPNAGIQIMADAADPNMAQQYAVYAQSIIVQTMGDYKKMVSGTQLETTGSIAAMPSVSTQLLYNPRMKSAYNFVPGIMGMLMILICAMMTSVSIVREKERGTMEVLLVSPVKPVTIVIAKAVPYMLLALGILATVLLLSYFVLGVPLAGSLFWICAVSLIYILLALSLGLLISSIATTQVAALLMSGMMLMLPTIMLSGMMFPVESMPTILQYVTMVVPPKYYISAMRKLMIMGVGIENVMTEIMVLTGMTVLLLTIALLSFKKRLE
ncbi:MAG: ABC transporter permease [Prevotellaceae bacterium]|nr:ABC transporter permease [Prevotella sp.]MDD7258210.1 ABC transporter permease [Prevotellaceae bacterium]MDY6130607.1 ABC transporter permease [Prevotella sp.]